MGLGTQLVQRIHAYGFDKPTELQRRMIPPVLQARDVVVQASAGIDRTAAFCIPILQLIEPNTKATQAIVLVHTRELARNLSLIFCHLSEGMNITCRACIGGTVVQEDMALLQQGAHVVVTTPGRAHDMILRRALKTKDVKIVCVSEVDEMVSRMLTDQVVQVLRSVPNETRHVLVSSTMPDEVDALIERFLEDPVRIHIDTKNSLASIQEFYVAVEKEEWKPETLCDLFENIDGETQAVIFCNSAKRVTLLSECIKAKGLMFSVVHDDITKLERESGKEHFLAGSSKGLITTDLLARDVDVQKISLVINYDLPMDHGAYVERARRDGAKGIVINFVTKQEVDTLGALEQTSNKPAAELPLDIRGLIADLHKEASSSTIDDADPTKDPQRQPRPSSSSVPTSLEMQCQGADLRDGDIANAFLEVQRAEKYMEKALLIILALAPNSAAQLEKYISPNLREKLNLGESNSTR